MTDLTSNSPRTFQGAPLEQFEYPVAANTQLFAGSALMVNGSGFAANCTPTASGRFLGFAVGERDNRTGSVYGGTNGSSTVNVALRGLVRLTVTRSSSTWGQADIGATCYASDGNVFTDSAGTNNIIVGKIVHIESLGSASSEIVVYFESTLLRSI